MFKHTKLFVPVVLAAGALLLTACDQGASADDAAKSTTPSTNSSATGDATQADSTEGEATPAGGGSTDGAKDCGNTALNNGPTLLLVPDKGTAGYATCDQVRAVWDEFNSIAEQSQIPAEGVTVDSDWQCVPKVENGDPVGADCFTPAVPDANNPVELKFHAEPAL
jgi:hypothetical protein